MIGPLITVKILVLQVLVMWLANFQKVTWILEIRCNNWLKTKPRDYCLNSSELVDLQNHKLFYFYSLARSAPLLFSILWRLFHYLPVSFIYNSVSKIGQIAFKRQPVKVLLSNVLIVNCNDLHFTLQLHYKSTSLYFFIIFSYLLIYLGPIW